MDHLKLVPFKNQVILTIVILCNKSSALIATNYVFFTRAIKLATYIMINIMIIPCFQVYWQHPKVLCLIICFAYISTLYLVLLCKQTISQQETPSKCKPLQLQERLKLGQPHLFIYYITRILRTALLGHTTLHSPRPAGGTKKPLKHDHPTCHPFKSPKQSPKQPQYPLQIYSGSVSMYQYF